MLVVNRNSFWEKLFHSNGGHYLICFSFLLQTVFSNVEFQYWELFLAMINWKLNCLYTFLVSSFVLNFIPALNGFLCDLLVLVFLFLFVFCFTLYTCSMQLHCFRFGRFRFWFSIGDGINGVLFKTSRFRGLCIGGFGKGNQFGPYTSGSSWKWSYFIKSCLSCAAGVWKVQLILFLFLFYAGH